MSRAPGERRMCGQQPTRDRSGRAGCCCRSLLFPNMDTWWARYVVCGDRTLRWPAGRRAQRRCRRLGSRHECARSEPRGGSRMAASSSLRFRRSSATFDWWETGLSNRRPSLRQHCDRRAEGLSPHSTRPRSEPQGGLPGETVAETKFRSRAGPRPGHAGAPFTDDGGWSGQSGGQWRRQDRMPPP